MLFDVTFSDWVRHCKVSYGTVDTTLFGTAAAAAAATVFIDLCINYCMNMRSA